LGIGRGRAHDDTAGVDERNLGARDRRPLGIADGPRDEREVGRAFDVGGQHHQEEELAKHREDQSTGHEALPNT
jgi:hypothetical protein